MKTNKYSFLLLVILVISLFIRLFNIKSLSLFGDEIDVGYQAYSILKTGHDYKGNFLPTYIQSLSESRAPLLIYLSIPGIKIFGLNELGVRITPVIFGLLSIFVFYKLILLLSNSQRLSVISAAVLSFNPWHFHYSRVSFEVTLLLTLILTAIYFAFKFISNSKNKYLYLSILFFCLCFYTYNTANIFVPLLVIFIFLGNFSKFKTKLKVKNILVSIIVFLLIAGPIIYQIFFGTAANRFNLVGIFNDQKTINQIIDQRTSFSASDPKTESLFHNKPIYFSREFFKNYLSSISPIYLFITGDQYNLRHSVPGFGLLFISFTPLLIIGLFSLKTKEKLNQLMLFWLISGPIASSLTINGGTHATRLFIIIAPLCYFIGLGLDKILNLNFSKPLFVVFSACFLLEVCLYAHQYFVHYPKDSFEVWNKGYKEIFQNIPQDSNNTFISNANYNSLLPYLFYQKYDPNQFISDKVSDLNRENIYSDLGGFSLNSNTFFINNWGDKSDFVNKIYSIAKSKDTFVLFQLKEIPGDMNLYQKPIPGFNTIRTIFNPNHTILAQIIQKQ